MAHAIIELIAEYGLLLVFINVLVEQAGAPVPAVPTLVVAGALASAGKLPLGAVILAALLACLIADLAWYWAGHRFGAAVMRTLCRISLSPDSCVKQSELRFQRWRGGILLVAKFIPGLSTIAPPLAGAMRLSPLVFLLMDALGSLIWIGVVVGLGYAFAHQIDHVLFLFASAGTVAIEVIVAALIAYVLVKWWQRRKLLLSLRLARITVDELHRLIELGDRPVVVDVRSPAGRMVDTRVIPGAVMADLRTVERDMEQVSIDQEVVIYCSCPNEVSAAKAAKGLMMLGYRRVRPLHGGLDAWADAGYAIERLTLPQEVSLNPSPAATGHAH
ncbi:DedA family protein/thiosulfate sulfurtransferase GlpE [Dyella caseinilytica]|uniref:DedA family protein/thiosulfate sulfurtransferase GlpE n=1 Tax=Dyella caseinilytica TaxID=1849581 RepID=A0ABX7GZT6_9GAMM|nr:DedA family protein/thiosulfate sulfurtransferase GlpE [Dyella caseinilytica]QRN55443.1 DedA family protein/thiosulfate sulfurtransferase GlpE [Dyella caseinilytica]GGA01754.1 membrane protein [Dyella caseinilytica]